MVGRLASVGVNSVSVTCCSGKNGSSSSRAAIRRALVKTGGRYQVGKGMYSKSGQKASGHVAYKLGRRPLTSDME